MNSDHAPIRVLIVDDDFMVARIHTGFVERIPGFTVQGVAHTAADTKRVVTGSTPDLILLDLYLPDRFGLDLLGDLRKLGFEGDAMVITAAKEMEAVRGALRRGVVDYLLKPFSFNDLEERLTRYADNRPTLRGDEVDDQGDVDQLFAAMARRRAGRQALPKGLSPETMALIESTLARAEGGLSATEAAELTGVSRVSARRYLEYFVANGRATVSLRYGTSGRPEREYHSTRR